jgi:hypothetical protein
VYYVWETRRRRDNDVMVPEFPAVMKEHKVSFIAGRRFLRPLPELEIRFEARGVYHLTDDLVIRRRRCIVHSHRLAEVLRKAGVDGIDYYPCRLVNDLDGAVHRTHQAANILDVIYCLDREQSELDIDDEEPNEIWTIERLKILEDRLGDSLMFRLGERRNTVIVHQIVKDAIEREGLTGPVFLPVDGYREWPGYSLENPRNVVGTHDLDPDGPADQTDDGDAEAGE